MIGQRVGGLVLALVVIGGGVPATATEPVPIAATLGGRAWRLLPATPDGMRGLDGFGDADGMLFDRGRVVDPQSVFFVMDGVAFPLAIAWFDGAGRLVGTTTMATCPAEPCPRHAAPAPFRWAIEAPVGAFDDVPADARLEVPLD